MPFSIVFLLFIFACAFSSFNLGILLVYNETGLVLIVIGLFVALLRSNELDLIKNPIAFMIAIYLVFVFVQVALTSFNYGQSIFRGVITARLQLYYLSFFLFIILLDSREKIKLVIKGLAVIAFTIVILSGINYFGVTIFKGMWAEGHGVRGGIVRAFVPSMDIMAFVLCWHFSNWLEGRNDKKTIFSIFLFLAIHFFRQTRMRIIAVILTMATVLIAKKKYKELVLASIVGIIAIGLVQVTMKENILISSFTSVAEDLDGAGGTWGERDRMTIVAFEEFQKYPFLGSGLLTLSLKSSEFSIKEFEELSALRKLTDLGYVSWLKAFGMVGVVWLLLFIALLLGFAYKAYLITEGEDRMIALTCLSYFIFVIISNVTISHFLTPFGILMVCFCAAVSIRLIAFKHSSVKVPTY